MSSLPLFLKSETQNVLITGTTAAALSKAAILLERSVPVTLIGSNSVKAVQQAGLDQDYADLLTIYDRPFSPDDLTNKTLVYIAEDDTSEEERILTWAQLRKIPVNVVDKPALSSFTTPAALRRGPVSIAIASGGAAPVFIRRIRSTLERSLPQSLTTLSTVAGQIREELKSILTTVEKRRQFWDSIYDHADDFTGLNENATRGKIIDLAHRRAQSDMTTGRVQLVGAGPGDPELLTIKAHRALQQADIIFYDRLVSRDILSLARRDAEIFFVGKREGDHGIGQDMINSLLVKHAKLGKTVVRLKGGDPMTFARAGEELTTLRQHRIPVQIIPGITALAGIAAKAQIPMTDRSHAASLTLITGTLQDGSSPDWAHIAGEGKTLAVYMGVKKAGQIAQGLTQGGTTPTTPVAIIENGTRENERQIYTTLEKLEATVTDKHVKSPALLIIGDVVSEAQSLQSGQNTVIQPLIAMAEEQRLSA